MFFFRFHRQLIDKCVSSQSDTWLIIIHRHLESLISVEVSTVLFLLLLLSVLDRTKRALMAEDDDDVPLLNGDDEQLITSNDRPPNVEAVFVVTFDVRDGKMEKDRLDRCSSSLFKGTPLNFKCQINKLFH